MASNISIISETALKLFFMLTPFFVLSMFVTMTSEMTTPVRKALAWRALISINITCLILYFFGQPLFKVFGITVDSFRIGAGIVLLLTAIELVRGTAGGQSSKQVSGEKDHAKTPTGNPNDLAVVPLTIPYVVGPGTIGMLLVTGGEAVAPVARLYCCLGIVIACTGTGAMLYFSDGLMKRMGHRTLQILSKITGLVLAAISAQSVMTGILNLIAAGQP